MLYDIAVTATQLRKAAEWADDGPDSAEVELAEDNRMLVAAQGDEKMAWDASGEPGTDEYVALAPLSPANPLADRIHLVAVNGRVDAVHAFASAHDAELFALAVSSHGGDADIYAAPLNDARGAASLIEAERESDQ